MTTTTVRYVSWLVALLGITLLIWRTASSGSGTGYDTVRLIHILAALALFGMFEAVFARSKRARAVNSTGQQLGTISRILLSLALLVGIILLLSIVFSWITGDTYSLVVYLHALLGLSAVGVLSVLFVRGFNPSK